MGSYGLVLLPASSAIISTARRFLDRNDAGYTRRRSSNKKHHWRVSCCSGDQDQVVVVVDRRGSTGSSSAAAGATKIQQISGELYKCDKDAKTCHPLDAGVARFELPSPREREMAKRAIAKALIKMDLGSFENQHAWDSSSNPGAEIFCPRRCNIFECRDLLEHVKSRPVRYPEDSQMTGDVTRGGRLEGVPRLRLLWLNMAADLERFSMAADLESPYDPTFMSFMMSHLFVDHLIHSFLTAEGLNMASELESPSGNGVDFTDDPTWPFGKVEGTWRRSWCRPLARWIFTCPSATTSTSPAMPPSSPLTLTTSWASSSSTSVTSSTHWPSATPTSPSASPGSAPASGSRPSPPRRAHVII